MSNQKYNKSNTIGKKESLNRNVIIISTQDGNNMQKEESLENIEFKNLLSVGPSEKLKSLVGKPYKRKIKGTNLNNLLKDTLSEQLSCQEITSDSAISLDLPHELLNIGPSEKLKRLRRSIPSRKNTLEVSLSDEQFNGGLNEKIQRIHGPTFGNNEILEQSLPYELINLGPSEKLQRLRGPSLSTNGSLDNSLPNELRNVGPSEKLRKLRGPTLPNKGLLKRCSPDDHVIAIQSKKCKEIQGTNTKLKENAEKPHKIFQKRLQAVIKKPLGSTLKKIEPLVVKTNSLKKNKFAKEQYIRQKGVTNKCSDIKEVDNAIPIVKYQDLPVNSDQTCILDLKGSPKLIVKGSGRHLVSTNKTSKFFKVPLNVYDELKKEFKDAQCPDKKKTEQILRSLEHCQTVSKQNSEVDEFAYVHDDVPDGDHDYSEEETQKLKTHSSQHSGKDNDGDDTINTTSLAIITSNDAPKVKLNSKQSILISHAKNKSLHKELNEINEFRRREFPRTYKKNNKRRFLFSLRNKVDSSNSIAASAVSQIVPNRVPSEPLEPIDLEAGEWYKLYNPSDIRMPIGTSIAPMIHKLRTRLPSLTGKDKHEVSFLLSIMSTFPNMPKEIKQLMHQRLNLVYLAIMFDWETALTLAEASEPGPVKSNNSPSEEFKSNQLISKNCCEPKANSSIRNIKNISNISSLTANESTSLKPQYRFEILIKEKALTPGTKFGS